MSRVHERRWYRTVNSAAGSSIEEGMLSGGGDGARAERPRVESDGTLASRLQSMIHRLFVGRAHELATLASAHEDDATGVVFVSGEFGMGKSALLKRFAAVLAERGAPNVWLDAQSVDFTQAFADAAERLRELRAASPRPVLFVDHFHALAEDKQWFFDAYLPSLPDRTLVVVANRHDLTRMCVGTSGLVVPFCRRVNVCELSADEAHDYLRRRGVPESSHDGMVEFARGVPLLLVLATEIVLEACSTWSEHLERRTLSKLSHEFLRVGDGAKRRDALAALALARRLDSESLAWALGEGERWESVHRWLATRSFVHATPFGLRLHASARSTLLALLRIHHPNLLESMGARLRAFYDGQLASSVAGQDAVIADRLFLESHVAQPLEDKHGDEDAYELGVAHPDDRDDLLAMTERSDGPAVAAWVRRWLEAGLGTWDVIRAASGRLLGYALSLDAPRDWPEPIADDPALRAIGACLAATRGACGAFVVRNVVIDGSAAARGSAPTLLTSRVFTRARLPSDGRRPFIVTARERFWMAAGATLGFEPTIVTSFTEGAVERAVVAYDALPVPEAFAKAAPPDGELGSLLRGRLAQLAHDGGLTDREKQVLDLVALGRNASEIGKVLGIAPRTAKFHQARLLAKLGADSRVDLLRLLL